MNIYIYINKHICFKSLVSCNDCVERTESNLVQSVTLRCSQISGCFLLFMTNNPQLWKRGGLFRVAAVLVGWQATDDGF